MTTTPPIQPDPKRKWYGLALRHLRMAYRLLDSGFPDGAIFHTYHAYECVLSAFIAANGCPVPPVGRIPLVSPTGKKIFVYPSPKGDIPDRGTHKARQMFFAKLADTMKPYYLRHTNLSRYLTLDDRMDSLYYDAIGNRLPHEIYNHSFVVNLIPEVNSFAREVWRDIRYSVSF